MNKIELEKEIKKYCIISYTRARACGSHGRRCLWDICGKPMIGWVLKAIKNSKYVNKMVVATEDDQIKKVAESYNGIVIDRPLHTAMDYPRDYTKGTFKRVKPRSLMNSLPTIYSNLQEYTLYYLEESLGIVPDLILYVGANRPLISTETIDKVIEAFFEDEEANTSMAVYEVDPDVYTINPRTGRITNLIKTDLDRQIAIPLFKAGMCNLRGLPLKTTSTGLFIASVIVKEEEGLDVHNNEDLFKARCYMRRRLDNNWVKDLEKFKPKEVVRCLKN